MTSERRGPRWIAIVPNVLSAARLMLAAAFPLCPREAWPWLIIAAGLTDLIDGVIARRLGATSWAGGILDAVADKTFAMVVLVSLTAAGLLTVWQALLLVVRDAVVLSLAAWAAVRGQWSSRDIPHRPLGRYTTAAMFVVFLVATFLPQHRGIVVTVVILAAILNIAAAVDYLLAFRRYVRSLDEAPAGR